MKPEVVFVPGLLGDRWSFKEVQDLMDVPTYAFDYPATPFSLVDMAREVGNTVKEGGYVVGTSMGGYVALLTAVMFPEKLGGIVLINTFASPRRILGHRRLLIHILGYLPKGKWIKWIVRSGIKDSHFGYDDKVKAYVLGVLERLTPEALYNRVRALADAPEIGTFPGVRAMVTYNEDDPTIPTQERKYLINLVNPVKIVVCKGGGHFPYLRSPEGFTSTLFEFMGRERL